jgi:hypothetical protein
MAKTSDRCGALFGAFYWPIQPWKPMKSSSLRLVKRLYPSTNGYARRRDENRPGGPYPSTPKYLLSAIGLSSLFLIAAAKLADLFLANDLRKRPKRFSFQ